MWLVRGRTGARNLKIWVLKSMRNEWLIINVWRQCRKDECYDTEASGWDARLRMLCTVRWSRHPLILSSALRSPLRLGREDIIAATEFCTCRL